MNHLNPQQMTAVLDAARESDPTLRKYIMILLSVRHGLRASETCGLRVQDFDVSEKREQAYLTVQRKKGSLKTTQPLFPEEKVVVVAFLAGKKASDFIFPGRYPNTHVNRRTFYNYVRDNCQAVGVPKSASHPHALKHTCGMTLIPHGFGFTMQYLGHRSANSTGVYIRPNDEAASQVAMAAFGAA